MYKKNSYERKNNTQRFSQKIICVYQEQLLKDVG